MKRPIATTKIATVTSLLPNSTQRCTSESPVAPLATRLVAVQSGQFVQPSPDWLSRTPAPVRTIRIDVTRPAPAHRLRAIVLGASSAPDRKRHHHWGAAAAVVGTAGTGSMVGGTLAQPIGPLSGSVAGCAAAGDHDQRNGQPLPGGKRFTEQGEADQGRHGWLHAHQDAEHASRETSQRLKLQPVRND